MSDIYMKRPALTCSKCGGNEFTVEVNYCIPRAVSLSCKCGYITPIAFFSKSGRTHAINGLESNKLYHESFCRDIEDIEAAKAVHDDVQVVREKEKNTSGWTEGRLGYNGQNDRYGLLVSDLWVNEGFHCGECLQVKVDDEWVDTRFEMSTNKEWYLVNTPYRGIDIEYVKARIISG